MIHRIRIAVGLFYIFPGDILCPLVAVKVLKNPGPFDKFICAQKEEYFFYWKFKYKGCKESKPYSLFLIFPSLIRSFSVAT